MRATAWLLLVLSAVASAAGCDWRSFDDLQKNTPVAAISAPSNYPAKDEFGAILLALGPPPDGSSAGRFIALGSTRASVGVISFDAAGNSSGVGVNGDAINQLMQGPINSIAEIPGAQSVVMGAPTDSFGDVLKMQLDAPRMPGAPPQYPTMTFQPTVGEAWYGVGVGAGQIGGGAASEVIVLSEKKLHVFVDGQPNNDKVYPPTATDDPACPLAFSGTDNRDRLNRAVIVGQLMASGMQIAVGTPVVGSSQGHVSVLDVDLTTGTFTCAAALSATEARFGRSMALVDLDGDHMPDHLLVGAPPTHAYLYSLPLSTGQAPVGTATDPTGGYFGGAVAAFNIDGAPGDEMFVGNPDATVGGATKAGNVTVYAGATMAKLPATAFPNPLAENQPGGGDGYGSGIVGMTFCPGNVLSGGADGGTADAGTGGADGGIAPCGPLPIVGALSKTFAYFTLKPPDPRVK
jgi:hypothetical protein